jgi:hypothetical protein
MKKFLCLLLLWLMIAVPLQGMAASAMIYCGAGHYQAMDEANGHSSEHASHGERALVAESCSSCADCCLGCAPVTPSMDIAVFRPSSEKIDLVFSSYVGYIADGLERPPRA